MDELEEEKGKGGEKRIDIFLSSLESTITGTAWATYVHLQINRRITSSRASKWKRVAYIFHLVFFLAQVR